MTVYRQARQHLYRMLFGVAASFVFVVVYERTFGHSFIPFAICTVILFAMTTGMWKYNCPRCGSNLFLRGNFALPWPNKHCSHCALDLTAPDAPENDAGDGTDARL